MDSTPTVFSPEDTTWPAGASEMAGRMRRHSWENCALGVPHTWPPGLRSVVDLLLASPLPVCMLWGPKLTLLYNDHYRSIIDAVHPEALGQSARTLGLHALGLDTTACTAVLGGENYRVENRNRTITRGGTEREAWFDFFYAPVSDDQGQLTGIYVTAVETTDEVLALARQQFRSTLEKHLRMLQQPLEVLAVASEKLGFELNAGQVAYAEIDDSDEYAVIARDWNDGTMPSNVGRHRLDDFGPQFIAELRRGKPIVVENVASHSLTSEPAAVATFERVGIQAFLNIPLIKNNRLLAVLAVHSKTPRKWLPTDLELAEEAAERTWTAFERARIEQALRESEEKLRRIFSSAPVFLAVHEGEEHRYIFSNPMHDAIVGNRELLGRTLREAMPELKGQGVFERFDEVYRTGKPIVNSELEAVFDRNGSGTLQTGYFHQMIQPWFDTTGSVAGVMSFAFDITEQVHARNALIESEERWKLSLDASRAGAWELDLQTQQAWRSERHDEIFGYDELLPEWSYELFLEHVIEEDRPAVEFEFQRALRDGVDWRFECRIHRADGEIRWIRARGRVRHDAHDQPMHIRGVVEDVTEEKQSEILLREADRRKDEFLAVLGHELRNPLAPLCSGLELLRQQGGTPQQQGEALAIIDRQVANLVRLVDDLLDVSRINRGKVELRRAPLDLHDVLDAAIELFEPVARERGQELEINRAEPELPVVGDSQRLTQIIGNLLSNAAKFSDPGSPIRVYTRQQDGTALVGVVDRGMGIPPDRLDAIFEMFSQVPEHRANTGGTGLGVGLALARQLVSLHGGTIEAQSAGLDQGSEFVMRLPLAVSASDTKAESEAVSASASTGKRRVLIVDDNIDAAESLRVILELAGHSVWSVYDGYAALGAVNDYQPDVVLLDLGLPEMDGYEVARRIRAQANGSAVLLCAVTGWGQSEDRRRTEEAGFDYHFTKPVDLKSLRNLLAGTADPATPQDNLSA